MAKKVKRQSTIPQSRPAGSDHDRPSPDAERPRSRRARREAETRSHAATTPSPAWLVPTACTFLIVGILYMVLYYITNAQLPLPIGDWNLAVGVGLILVGGALFTGWK